MSIFESLLPSIKNLADEVPIAFSDLFCEPPGSVRGLPRNEATEGPGRYERHRGYPVLRLRGEPETMGRIRGRVFGGVLPSFVRHYLETCLGSNRRSRGYRSLRQFAEGCREFIPDRYLREINGMARSTSLDETTLLSAMAFLDFYSMVLCSCIYVGPERSRYGRPLVGRNLDFPAMGVAHRVGLIHVYHHEDYNDFLSFSWPGMIGVLTGINKKGLYLAVAEVDGTASFGRGLPYTLMHRRILEECDTVDDAGQLLRSTSRTRSNNLMVADRSTAAVFEYDRHRVIRRNPKEGLLFHTNHFASDRMKTNRVSFKYLSARLRYRKIKRYLDQASPSISGSDLQELLSKVSLGRLNLLSVLFAPEDGHLVFRAGAPPATSRQPIQTSVDRLFDERLTGETEPGTSGKRDTADRPKRRTC